MCRRRVDLSVLALLGSTLVVPAVALAGDGWNQVMQDQQMTVWQRQVPGGRIKEVKAAGLFDSPPAAVFAVLNDFDHYTGRMPYVSESRVVGTEEAGKVTYYYSVVDAPLVSKRDYTLKVTVDRLPENDDGVYHISWVSGNSYAKAPPPRNGYVRVETVSGSWELKPFTGGKTFAVYYILTDPGGSVPAFAIDKGNTKVVPEVFEAVRKTAKQAPYNLAK